MTRFVVGNDRSLSTLFPERLDVRLGPPRTTGDGGCCSYPILPSICPTPSSMAAIA